ncbi:MAG: hypothetical protein Q7S33_00770 [Nanoarchaeota archaeon]|nr:hypothetical protein [Nanoarchaeota archaeon]
MTKVNFKFDKEKDLYNIWETCNSKSNWYNFKQNVTSNVLKICGGKEFEDCKNELENIAEKIYKSSLINIFVESVNKSWEGINNEYFNRLEKIMKKPICSKDFTAYLTTAGRCPYDPEEKTFFFSFFNSLPNAMNTTGHEIMHLQFHEYYWQDTEKQLGKEKTADLKEALTVLLNLEFNDLWFAKDIGYEPHKELRKFIANEWKKEKDFDVLIEKCVDYLKEKH